MPKIVTSIVCRVQVLGKVKPSEYTEAGYRSVLFVEAEYFGKPQEEVPESARIWQSFDADDEALRSLQKGTWVELLPIGEKNGKPRYGLKLMTLPTQPQTAQTQPQTQTPELTPAQKRAIAAKVEQDAALLKFCYDQARQKFAGVIDDPESLRALATTLFIQAVR